MAKTERSKYRFTVKEFGDGTPWIMLEPDGQDLACLGDGFLGLDLKPGHTLDDAQEVASFLNKHITTMAYTQF